MVCPEYFPGWVKVRGVWGDVVGVVWGGVVGVVWGGVVGVVGRCGGRGVGCGEGERGEYVLA